MRSRQPPPTDLTGEEIASSNTTLNTLLGGRQKSWMTGGGGTVRPTPRDQMRQRSSLSVLPSPAPSGEPSPVFPHPQEHAPKESKLTESQPSGPPQAQGQPATSEKVRGPPQRPNMQIQRGNPPSSAPLLETRLNSITIQRPRPALSNTPSLQSRLHLIDSHVRAHGGLEKLSSGIERPRFSLLREACVDEDYFFVALHQLFCLWTIDPPRVTKIDGFRDITITSNAFQLVTKLIRPNDGISRVHLEWFSEFPSPLHGLVARSDSYRRTLAAVSTCLNRLIANKAPLLQHCLQRGYPPLVDEMVNSLGFISPILQAVFFTASRRTLGVPDDDTGARMEQLFRKDRDGHRLLAARYNSSSPPSQQEVTERNRRIADGYMAIRSGQQDPLSNGGSNHTRVIASHSQSPVFQQFSPGFGAPPQTPISAMLHTVPSSPAVQHFDSGTGAPLQRTDLVEESQDSNKQSTEIHQSNSAINSGQVFSTGPSSTPTSAEASHEQPTYQFQSVQTDFPRYPQQQMANNFIQNPVPILRSNHHLHHHSHSIPSMPKFFSSTVPAQAQPNLTQQRIFHALPQNNIQQGSSRIQQTSQLATNQNPRNPLRPQGGLTVMTQGLVSGGQPLVTPSPTSSVYRNYKRPSQSSRMKSPPLIPLNGQSLPAHAPNPDINAIHHSYLRSPYMVPRDVPSGLADDAPAGRYYQAVKEFAVGPVMLPHQLTLSVWEFRVSDINFAKIAKDKIINLGSPAVREVQQGSLQYRMRCIVAKQDDVKRAVDCAVADTVWPPSIFMEINGVTIDVRRKLLHGKDLPVDITRFIANNIKNQVKVSVPRLRKQRKDHDYIFSVEAVELLQHRQILDMCLQKQRIPAQQTIESISRSLSGSLVDDDDISMAVGDLTINLADPFMARIFSTPARGSSCLHRECFDLETFLLTRNSKPKLSHQISMVDVWKCPLCGRDARPYSLRVDDFLMSVRESLEKQNLLETHAIVVAADGSWKPKPDELPTKRRASQAGLDDADDSDEGYQEKARILQKSRDAEIIILDDD